MTNGYIGLFLAKVRLMRSLQVKYFKTRDKGVLEQSKKSEREVDQMLKSFDDEQNSLFPALPADAPTYESLAQSCVRYGDALRKIIDATSFAEDEVTTVGWIHKQALEAVCSLK